MAPEQEWRIYDDWFWREMLSMFAELDLRTFDLMEPLQAAIDRGIPLTQTPGDTWHPSPAVAEVFADWLLRQGLIRDLTAPRHSSRASPPE